MGHYQARTSASDQPRASLDQLREVRLIGVHGLFAAGLIGLLAAASSADARSGVQFLGSDPIGPLAVVQGGVVKTPGDRACRSWAPVGSRWRELDTFGRVAGEVTVESREYYEVCRCDELHVRRLNGKPGAGVFVDARVAYRTPAVASWQPARDAAAAFDALVRAHQDGIRNLDPAHRVPFERRALFFEWSATGQRYAVVGGTSLLVLRFEGGRWVMAHEQKPEKMRSQDAGYKALVVTDMNADGRPEIVVHHKEERGEWYGDFTLSLQPDGSWQEVAPGIFGSTA
jgi:hypothetical protein